MWLTQSPEQMESCQEIIVSLKDNLEKILAESGKIDALYALDAFLFSLASLPSHRHHHIPYKRSKQFINLASIVIPENLSDTAAKLSHTSRYLEEVEEKPKIPNVRVVSTCAYTSHHRLPSLSLSNRITYMNNLNMNEGKKIPVSPNRDYQRPWLLKNEKTPHLSIQFDPRGSILYSIVPKEDENNSNDNDHFHLTNEKKNIKNTRNPNTPKMHNPRLNTKNKQSFNQHRNKKLKTKIPSAWLKIDDIISSMAGFVRDASDPPNVKNVTENRNLESQSFSSLSNNFFGNAIYSNSFESRVPQESSDQPDWIAWIDCDAFLMSAQIDLSLLLSGLLSKLSPNESPLTSKADKLKVMSIFDSLFPSRKMSYSSPIEVIDKLMQLHPPDSSNLRDQFANALKLPFRQSIHTILNIIKQPRFSQVLLDILPHESFPQKGENNQTNFILSSDHIFLNTGVMFVRNHPDSLRTLITARTFADRSPAFRHAPWWEQNAFGSMWLLPLIYSSLLAPATSSWKNSWSKFGVSLAPQHVLNSFSSVNEDYGRAYTQGEDLIMHFAGCGRKENIGKCAEIIEEEVKEAEVRMKKGPSEDILVLNDASSHPSLGIGGNKRYIQRLLDSLEKDLSLLESPESLAKREKRLEVTDSASKKLHLLKNSIKSELLIY